MKKHFSERPRAAGTLKSSISEEASTPRDRLKKALTWLPKAQDPRWRWVREQLRIPEESDAYRRGLLQAQEQVLGALLVGDIEPFFAQIERWPALITDRDIFAYTLARV